MTAQLQQHFAEILSTAGIELNGSNSWDIQVHDPIVYSMVASNGSLGLGEAYMQGMWDCDAIDEFIFRCSKYRIQHQIKWKSIAYIAFFRLLNFQKKSRAFSVGEAHYNLGNDLFEVMLDTNMAYSCGYWRNAANLDQAQLNKIHLIANKLGLKPGMRVLDIGCGWGTIPAYLAQHYGVEVVGVTISTEQARYAQKKCETLPVDIRVQDYRSLSEKTNEKFDRIYSIGMFEHVGRRNYRTYMKVVKRCLKDDGVFVLHTIGAHSGSGTPDPWMSRYIFPNGMIPQQGDVMKAIGQYFIIEDWHNFGRDYDKTLMAWLANFDRAWPDLSSSYDQQFYRMWRYYLMISAGSFRSRLNQLWQITLSPRGAEHEPQYIR